MLPQVTFTGFFRGSFHGGGYFHGSFHRRKLPRKLLPHGSYHVIHGSFHGSFHELPRKRHVVQETVHSPSFCVWFIFVLRAYYVCAVVAAGNGRRPQLTILVIILYPIIFSTYLRPKKSCLHPTLKTITYYCRSSSKKSGQTNAAPSRCMTAYSSCRRSYPQRSCWRLFVLVTGGLPSPPRMHGVQHSHGMSIFIGFGELAFSRFPLLYTRWSFFTQHRRF